MPNTVVNTKIKAKTFIRRARAEDIGTVRKLICSSASWYKDFVAKKDLWQHYVSAAWAEENFKKREFYLGLRDGRPFGTLSFQTLGNETGYLGYIYLDTDFVGQGLGKSLLNFALIRAREKNLREVTLLAHPQAHWATRAYKKFGFRRIASSPSEVLSWNNGAMRSYFEEGFELYSKSVA